VFIVAGIAVGIQTLVRFLAGRTQEGFTTVILLLMATGGCLMIALGIIGFYVAKIYRGVQDRPHYIIQ